MLRPEDRMIHGRPVEKTYDDLCATLGVIAEEAMQCRHYGRPLDPLWVETTAREAITPGGSDDR
jgi:hypothetical protein